jgi:hypothetical protein
VIAGKYRGSAACAFLKYAATSLLCLLLSSQKAQIRVCSGSIHVLVFSQRSARAIACSRCSVDQAQFTGSVSESQVLISGLPVHLLARTGRDEGVNHPVHKGVPEPVVVVAGVVRKSAADQRLH